MYLVFDVGGSSVKYALLTEQAEILKKGSIPTVIKVSEGVPVFVESLGQVYDELKSVAKIEGIAMGLPGQVDVERGIVYGGGAIVYLDDVPLRDLVSKRCDNLPVALENDGKCAALAECWKGNAKDTQDSLVLVFGTGIGCGVVKDKKIHHGFDFSAGEISYSFGNMSRQDLNILTNVDGMEDAYAAYELQPYNLCAQCSTAGMIGRVARAKHLPYSEVTGEKIYQWVEEKDSITTEIVEDVYFEIAKECCNLQLIFAPEVILIGGGISAQPKFIEGIKRYVDILATSSFAFQHIKIDVCKFQNDSNLLGALYNFLSLYKEN